MPIDEHVTCFVGKNESGKTNLLHALERLNSAQRPPNFQRLEYPTWLEKKHQRSGEFDSAHPISATFVLDDADITAVEERFGAGVLKDLSFTVQKDYANEITATVEVDDAAVVAVIAEQAGTTFDTTDISEIMVELAAAAKQVRTDAEGVEVATDEAATAATALEWVKDVHRNEDPAYDIGEFLVERMPKFFYFDEYDELAGRTRIEPLVAAISAGTVDGLEPNQRTALSLLNLGFANEEIGADDYETRAAEMQSIAADLTQKVRQYWRQNKDLGLIIDMEKVEAQTPAGERTVERYLQLRVRDERHFHNNSFDARSSGFRWFVSFLAAFSEFEDDSDVIVLLDEPALALHARAQGDFLAFIEDTLAATHQVLYTTHSPFMVDPAHLERVRVVEDSGPDVGSSVRTQLMSRDPDTLSPLQAALGYDIAQNLFVGPDNLVVEGLSDYTYLTIISERLRELDRTHLDPRWRILPAGGSGQMPAVIALLGQELDVTVIGDGGVNPPQRLTELTNEGILEGTRILMLGAVTGVKHADIEDLFTVEDYLRMYNATYAKKLTKSKLTGTDGILKRIKRADADFNHNDPANWLLSHRVDEVVKFSDETLDNFEKLFIAVNATLRTE